PGRAWAPRSPASATPDHTAAIRPREAPVFQPIDPPSVSMLTGNGLPYTPDRTGGRLLTRLTSSWRDWGVLYASPKAAPPDSRNAPTRPDTMITARRESRKVLA